MNLLYAPSQTEATKDICSHLNRKEKMSAYFISFVLGIIFFCIPAVLMFSFAFQMVPIAFAGLLIIVLILCARVLIHKQRMLLINTEYSKGKGYTIDDLLRR